MNISLLLLTLTFCSITLLAQTEQHTQLNESIRLWELNSDNLTGNIETDIGKLTPEKKVQFYGRLGEVWWKYDVQKGQDWFNKALKIIESPATDFAGNDEKLRAIRNLLKIVSVKDETILKKLLKRLTETTEELSKDTQNNNSKAIVETAILIADADPQKALDLGITATIIRNPSFSVILFWKLYSKNTTLSDTYFQAGLNRLVSYTENDFLFQIKLSGLPEITSTDGINNPKPNDLLRKRFLSQVADLLRLEANQVLEKRISQCDKFWFLGQNTQELFITLLPSKLESMIFTRNVCENAQGQSKNNEIAKTKSLKTIEDYLNAANETEDQEKKDNYRISAAGIAFKNKNYTQTIEILEDVSEEGRQLGGGIWSKFYFESWTNLVAGFYNNNEITSVYTAIGKSPDNLQPLLYLTVGNEAVKNKNRVLGFEFLTESRNLYRKVDFEPTNDYRMFFSNPVAVASIPKLFAELSYENEALESHIQAISSLNAFIAKIPSDEQDVLVPSLPIIWNAYTDLPETFFEKYFQNIQSSISNVKYLPLKVKLKLDVLKFSVFKLGKFQKESELLRKSNKKS